MSLNLSSSGRENDHVEVDWSLLVTHALYPTKVLIIEALCWIGQPLSAVQLERVLDEVVTNSAISYHLKTLCDQGVLEVVEIRPTRGTGEKLCFLTPSVLSGLKL